MVTAEQEEEQFTVSPEFLCVSLDASAQTLSLTDKRQADIRAGLSLLRLGARVAWKVCLRLLRLMAATVHMVPLGLKHMHPVQRHFWRLGLCP